MKQTSTQGLLSRIEELESRLSESEQLIDAIKAGEVDAFAFNKNNNHEIYTLHSGDYAYRILVENINEGALNLSEDGLIVYTNTYFCDLLNLPFEKIVGNSIFGFIHPSSEQLFKELFRKGLAGKSNGEIILSKSSSDIPVYVSLTSLTPTLATVGMIVSDLSEKKRQELLLKQQNTELAKMNVELETFNFVSSHDLQEPLRKIQLFSMLLVKEEKENMSANGQVYLDRLQKTAGRMQMLISDLLDYFQIKNAKSQFERTDLNNLMTESIVVFEELIKEKDAQIDNSGLCEIDVIPFQFRQLFQNLIGNALKFSSPERRPLITINCEKLTGAASGIQILLPEVEYCHIRIEDNGIGFAPAYNEKIFEAFQRLQEYEDYKGTGIGLAICKKIVENHHGLITASGTLNQGARFDIFVPVSRS